MTALSRAATRRGPKRRLAAALHTDPPCLRFGPGLCVKIKRAQRAQLQSKMQGSYGSFSKTRRVPNQVPVCVLVTTMSGTPHPRLLVSVADRSSV